MGGTERLSNLPNLTQPVGRGGRIHGCPSLPSCSLGRTSGHLPQGVLGVFSMCSFSRINFLAFPHYSKRGPEGVVLGSRCNLKETSTMSGALGVLPLKQEDVFKFLAAGTHVGGTNLDFHTEPYMHRGNSIGANINLKRTWEKLCWQLVTRLPLKTRLTPTS